MRSSPETEEIASFGFDEFLQTLGGDPSGSPVSVGLRVPSLVPAGGAWYLFLCARADLDPGDAIVGFRQLLHVGFPFNGNEDPTAAPLLPYEREVTSPGWHFADGNAAWFLTTQSLDVASTMRGGPLDQESFRFEDASTPALLYETATIPSPPAAPGYLGVTAYAPPAMQGTCQLMLRDVRATWHRRGKFHFPINSPTAVRFYAAVRQTSPSTRFQPSLTGSDFSIEGLRPEDNFVQFFPSAVYWRVGASLIVKRSKPCK